MLRYVALCDMDTAA